MDYYQLPFLSIHNDLEQRNYPATRPHFIRESFWKLVPHGKYDVGARSVLQSYLHRVEAELSSIIAKQSVGYWLHLYRRIAPTSALGEKDPTTIMFVRSILEAAIQKYASFTPCSRVSFSNEVPVESILNGALMSPEFETIRAMLNKLPQLVLTHFAVDEMQELYEAEKLAFEIWRSTAALRIVGKGANLIVVGHDPFFYDDRSDELDHLVTSYDDRRREPTVTATGTVFATDWKRIEPKDFVFLPSYNTNGISFVDLQKVFEAFNLRLFSLPGLDSRLNFVWFPFDLRSYYDAHRPYALSFKMSHKTSLESVLAVLAALCWRMLLIWRTEPGRIIHFWQRGYEGPYRREYLEVEIQTFLPAALQTLGIQNEHDIDLKGAMSFWELTQEKRSKIDLAVPGPHSLLLPFGESRLFVDHCWCLRLLYNLFFGLNLPDQNFKGDALEVAVRRGTSVLPTQPCISLNGEEFQIDAAFEIGETLVIAECKAVGISFGVERGDPQAISYRLAVVNRALKEIDDKAKLLSANPIGRNYDVTRFRRITPIAVTPFVEYIPSLAEHYWLSKEIPRVITPWELRNVLKGGVLDSPAILTSNVYLINH